MATGCQGLPLCPGCPQRHKKPVALYFYQKNSKACKQMDSELLTACRVQEVLGPAVKVRIDPSAGTRRRRLRRAMA